MSARELKRIEIIKRVIAKQCTQVAATQLNLSTRQIIRLVKEFSKKGEKVLLSCRREKISNHAHSPQRKGRVERVNATLQDRLVKELRLRGLYPFTA